MDRKQQLLALINAANQSDLTLEQVAFSVPTPVTGGAHNTQVVLTGQTNVSDTTTLSYDRVLLSTVFRGLTPVAGVPQASVTKDSVVASLNARYALTLDPEELDWAFDSATQLGTLSAASAENLYWRSAPISVQVVYTEQ